MKGMAQAAAGKSKLISTGTIKGGVAKGGPAGGQPGKPMVRPAKKR